MTPTLENFKLAVKRLRPVQRPSTWVQDLENKVKSVLATSYEPTSVATTLPSGRKLNVPGANDRIIQGAIQASLYTTIEQHKTPRQQLCKGTQKAVEVTKEYISQNQTGYFYKTDIKGFFTALDQAKVLEDVTRLGNITDKWVLDAITATIHTSEIGIPQGSPLSPLLAECVLIDLDKQMEDSGAFYLRYVDDVIILGTELQIKEGQNILQKYLQPLGLQLSHNKTQLGSYPKEGFVLLGESFFDAKPVTIKDPVILEVQGGSTAYGLSKYPGEETVLKSIIEHGDSRKENKHSISISKSHALKQLMEKPNQDILELIIAPECTIATPWGIALRQNKNKMLHAGYGKALHDVAFKTYVGKVKAANEAKKPVPIKDAAAVYRILLLANHILKENTFPETLATHNNSYQTAIEALQMGNYQEYRDSVSVLFKENYKLRQATTLPAKMAYEKEIDNGIDVLDV